MKKKTMPLMPALIALLLTPSAFAVEKNLTAGSNPSSVNFSRDELKSLYKSKEDLKVSCSVDSKYLELVRTHAVEQYLKEQANQDPLNIPVSEMIGVKLVSKTDFHVTSFLSGGNTGIVERSLQIVDIMENRPHCYFYLNRYTGYEIAKGSEIELKTVSLQYGKVNFEVASQADENGTEIWHMYCRNVRKIGSPYVTEPEDLTAKDLEAVIGNYFKFELP